MEELRDVAYAAKPEKRKTKQSAARNVSSSDPDVEIKTENSYEDNDNAPFDEKRRENDKDVDESINQTNFMVSYSQIYTNLGLIFRCNIYNLIFYSNVRKNEQTRQMPNVIYSHDATMRFCRMTTTITMKIL